MQLSTSLSIARQLCQVKPVGVLSDVTQSENDNDLRAWNIGPISNLYIITSSVCRAMSLHRKNNIIKYGNFKFMMVFPKMTGHNLCYSNNYF